MSKNHHLLTDLLLRKRQQRKNAQLLPINTPNGIAEHSYIEIGGISQWLTIRGEDKHNPVLLFIHGGPGSAYSIFNSWLRPWEKDFTIVQWDQRGAAKTFGKNGKNSSGVLSFARLAQDGIEVTEYLCRKLQQPKIILVGSSAGSLTGIMMAKQRPDLFYAYVGTDQNSPDPNHLAYPLALETLRAAGNQKGVRLLEKLGPVSAQWSRQNFMKLNRYMVKANKDVPNMITDLILPAMLGAPDYTLKDILNYFRGLNFSLEPLFEQLVAFNFEQVGHRFELPFYIFHGEKDNVTPTVTAKAWFDQIEAPHKEFVLIRRAGHLACFAQPDQFFEELATRVRPLALPVSAVS